MPDPLRAGRTPVRLVDSDVPEPADAFAAPTFRFADPDTSALRPVRNEPVHGEPVHGEPEHRPVRLGHNTGPAARADRPDGIVEWPSV